MRDTLFAYIWLYGNIHIIHTILNLVLENASRALNGAAQSREGEDKKIERSPRKKVNICASIYLKMENYNLERGIKKNHNRHFGIPLFTYMRQQ